MVPFPDADGEESLRQPVHPVVKGAEGETQATVGIDEKILIGMERDLVFENATDRFIDQLHGELP